MRLCGRKELAPDFIIYPPLLRPLSIASRAWRCMHVRRIKNRESGGLGHSIISPGRCDTSQDERGHKEAPRHKKSAEYHHQENTGLPFGSVQSGWQSLGGLGCKPLFANPGRCLALLLLTVTASVNREDHQRGLEKDRQHAWYLEMLIAYGSHHKSYEWPLRKCLALSSALSSGLSSGSPSALLARHPRTAA